MCPLIATGLRNRVTFGITDSGPRQTQLLPSNLACTHRAYWNMLAGFSFKSNAGPGTCRQIFLLGFQSFGGLHKQEIIFFFCSLVPSRGVVHVNLQLHFINPIMAAMMCGNSNSDRKAIHSFCCWPLLSLC